MKHFIFYTLEGNTIGINDEKVENCQLLGDSAGETAKEAFNKLLDENPWIITNGFNIGTGNIVARELVNNKRYLF